MDRTAFNPSKRVDTDGRPHWPSVETIQKILDATGTTWPEFGASGSNAGSPIVPDSRLDSYRSPVVDLHAVDGRLRSASVPLIVRFKLSGTRALAVSSLRRRHRPRIASQASFRIVVLLRPSPRSAFGARGRAPNSCRPHVPGPQPSSVAEKKPPSGPSHPCGRMCA